MSDLVLLCTPDGQARLKECVILASQAVRERDEPQSASIQNPKLVSEWRKQKGDTTCGLCSLAIGLSASAISNSEQPVSTRWITEEDTLSAVLHTNQDSLDVSWDSIKKEGLTLPELASIAEKVVIPTFANLEADVQCLHGIQTDRERENENRCQ